MFAGDKATRLTVCRLVEGCAGRSGAGEWLVEKHGAKTRRSWRKLHIGMDANTGNIGAAALTTNDVDDTSQVGPLLDQIEGPWRR